MAEKKSANGNSSMQNTFNLGTSLGLGDLENIGIRWILKYCEADYKNTYAVRGGAAGVSFFMRLFMM